MSTGTHSRTIIPTLIAPTPLVWRRLREMNTFVGAVRTEGKIHRNKIKPPINVVFDLTRYNNELEKLSIKKPIMEHPFYSNIRSYEFDSRVKLNFLSFT